MLVQRIKINFGVARKRSDLVEGNLEIFGAFGGFLKL